MAEKRLGKVKTQSVWVLTVGLVLLLAVSVLNGQSPPKKITAGITTLAGSTAVIYVTQKAGLFERHGLEVRVVYLITVPVTTSALISGDVQIALMSGSGSLSAAIGGADIVQIAGLVNKLAYGLMVSPSIKSLQELKGSSVGIAGLGGASEFAANYIFRKEGMVPGKDVVLLSVGGAAERLGALATGKLKAVLIEPPFTGKAEKMGFSRLVDFPTLDLEFQTIGVATTRSYLKTDRKTGLSFLKAITEAIYFYKTHKKETMTILASVLKMQDQDALEEMYSLYARHLYPEVPHSSVKGLQNTLDLLALRNPKARDKDPKEVIDDSVVKEMEESGFIAHLRKTYPISAR
jgi:ABC-type nitrate/sulfonate/bicarbonate transport system substrate-binding protein